MTSRLPTSSSAAKPNAVPIPWVSACGLVACPLAVPNTATSTARPSEPPASWSMFTSPDAAPESAAGTPASDALVSGTNTSPIPTPMSSIGPKTPDQ